MMGGRLWEKDEKSEKGARKQKKEDKVYET